MLIKKQSKVLTTFLLGLVYLLAVGCIVSEPATSATATSLRQPTEPIIQVTSEPLTIGAENVGLAVVSVPVGEKRWLTVESHNDFVTDWSPDGRSLLFSSSRDGNSELYQLNLASGDIERLTYSEWQDWDGRYSPNGQQIAYVSLTNPAQYARQIFLIDSDGSQPHQVTSEGDNTNPQWSPDGSKIVYHSDLKLVILDIASRNHIHIADLVGEQQFAGWSPDGQQLAFVSNHHNPQSSLFRLYLYNFATGKVELLIDDMENIAYATWSPDGRFLAFASNANSNHIDFYHLFLFDLTSGELSQLGEREAAHLVWSSNSQWIAFSSYEASRDLFIIRPDGSDLTRLISSDEDEWGGVWAPDGSQIAFLSERLPADNLLPDIPSPAPTPAG